MIWTFILGIAAGWGAGFAEEHLRPLVEKHLPTPPPTPVEMRSIALTACLFVAAIVAALSDTGGVVALTLGALLGVLGPRLYAKAQEMRAPDYDN